MGIPGSANPMLLGGGAVYEIEQSLRFNSADSAYLNRTPGTAGNRKTWTWSGWVKRAGFGQNFLFTTGADSSNRLQISFENYTNDNLALEAKSGGSTQALLVTNAVHRDPSAWYHIVVALDTTQATAANRLKFYVNGQEQISFHTSTYPSQNADLEINKAIAHNIGKRTYSSNYFDGYMAEVNFIDGSALNATDFGELDDNGVWRPIRYAGSYTGNSFYLKFASGDGTDSSGLSNTWTANNFTTSGTGTDVMSDTPTTNWCTLNPIVAAGYLIPATNGNLEVSVAAGSNVFLGAVGTQAITAGKFYWEITPTAISTSAGTWMEVGVLQSHLIYPSGAAIGAYNGGFAYTNNAKKAASGSYSAYGATWTTNDVVGVALDADSGSLTFYKNGVSQGVAYTIAASTILFSGLIPAIAIYRNTGITQSAVFNFGQRDFAYTPPTGFKALNTANLPAPDIADGGKYFDTKLYTGNNGTLTVTGLGFSPDLVWIKNREVNGAGHAWQDQVRGATAYLFSNSTAAENTNTANDWFRAFTSDGFTVAATTTGGSATSEWNNNGSGYVAWCWDAGGSGSSNTAGSITSTVSANPSAGFSIVTYTGTGANATVGHGLGVTPAMVIVKDRDYAASNGWMVKHQSLASNYNISLNQTAAAWNPATNGYISDLTSSTTFGLTTGSVNANNVNRPGDAHIAYCFAEVEGYSKFGSYTGNGSSDGPFVFLNFQLAYLLIRRTDTTNDWVVKDAVRNAYNAANLDLYANTSQAEVTFNSIDFTSNGFKIRNSNASDNASGGTYIFMAFAENPFGGSGVSPATAR